MRKLWFLFPCSVVLLIAFSMLACGSGSSNQLQSVSVSPATASGQAQFTATGTYSNGSKVAPLTALWSQNSPWSQGVANEFSLDTNGKASCLALAGTFMIQATAPVDPHEPLSQMGPTTPQVYGTAQLTCP
jgi:hypothetical protein